jgi:rubrerythrin
MIAAVGLSTALFMAATAAVSAQPGLREGGGSTPQKATLDNLSTAMHGEAFAYAKYLIFGTIADPAGNSALSKLFNKTAKVELKDHLAMEAALSKLVGDNAANLKDAINGENYETTSMYPGFAKEAYDAGDTDAGDLFADIGGDEATHRDMFAQALRSVSGRKSKVPAGPTAVAVAITPGGGAGLSATTRTNLETAMHGEAFAYAKYMLFAKRAKKQGQPQVAALFKATARVELTEHFREEANLYGLAGDNAANLKNAIEGETYEATTMYPGFALNAMKAGDYEVASAFLEIRGDEAAHAAAYSAALAGKPVSGKRAHNNGRSR